MIQRARTAANLRIPRDQIRIIRGSFPHLYIDVPQLWSITKLSDQAQIKMRPLRLHTGADVERERAWVGGTHRAVYMTITGWHGIFQQRFAKQRRLSARQHKEVCQKRDHPSRDRPGVANDLSLLLCDVQYPCVEDMSQHRQAVGRRLWCISLISDFGDFVLVKHVVNLRKFTFLRAAKRYHAHIDIEIADLLHVTRFQLSGVLYVPSMGRVNKNLPGQQARFD